MSICHIALWCEDLELLRRFYTDYFGAQSGAKYANPAKGYTSYFLSFPPGGCRMELMHRPDTLSHPGERGFHKGLAHIAISAGSREAVDNLTERLRADGHTIQSEPRTTGDGYYESAALDPEGNHIEITE